MNQESPNARRFPFIQVLSLLSGLLYTFFLRPQLLQWGTRLGESQRRLPGDELIPNPNLRAIQAIDIDAPAEAVWPWLAQMGRERTGWYGLDILTNNGIPSATYLRQEFPAPQPGTALDNGLTLYDMEPTRLLLITGYDMPNLFGTATDVTLLYLLERKSDGSTRLLVRLRLHAYGSAGRLLNFLAEPLLFVLGYQQLRGLKARAETMAYLKTPRPQPVEISLN